MKRVCIVGLGSIGKRHLRVLSERKDLTLEWIESNPVVRRKITDENRTYRSHESFEAMLATKPDVVVIATPHALHAAQSVKALDSGAHVFCEKPMSGRLYDALAILKTAGNAKGIFNVGFQLHFHPALMLLREMIHNGSLGNIIHIHCRVGTYVTLVNSVSKYQNELEGALFYDYCHQPDLLYWLTGMIPSSVYTSAFQTGELEYISNPNLASISFEYKKPFLSTIHLNYIQSPERHEYEVVGDLGWVMLDLVKGSMEIGLRSTKEIEVKSFSVNRDDLFRDEWEAFFLAAMGVRQTESSAEQAIVSELMCEGAMASWKNSSKFCFDKLTQDISSIH